MTFFDNSTPPYSDYIELFAFVLNKSVYEFSSLYQADIAAFFVDSAANVTRVESCFLTTQQIKFVFSKLQPGAIVRLRGEIFSFHLEVAPPFISMVEPQLDIVRPENMDIDWRCLINSFIRDGFFGGEMFSTWEIYEETMTYRYQAHELMLPE